jgi:hypothetical protein
MSINKSLLTPPTSFAINYLNHNSNTSLKKSLKSLLDNGKLYIRGNTFSFRNIQHFNHVFTLTDISKKKTIQDITNCFDDSSSKKRKPDDPLELEQFSGIFPCLELNIIDTPDSNIEGPITRIKRQIGHARNAESYMLFLTEEDPKKSHIDGNNNEISNIESFGVNGLIGTNCNIKLPGGLQYLSSEFIITPYFKGIIICIQKNYTQDNDLNVLLKLIQGERIHINNSKNMLDNIKKLITSTSIFWDEDEHEKTSKKRKDIDQFITENSKKVKRAQGKKRRTRTKPKPKKQRTRTRTKSKKQRTRTKPKSKNKSRMGRSPHKPKKQRTRTKPKKQRTRVKPKK